jgi:transcriptional regulator with XRE-family HTH domain
MPDDIDMRNRIRELREARGWVLHDLAAKAGISFEQISRIERGKNTTVNTLQKIADALEVPITALWPDESDTSPEDAEARRVFSRLSQPDKKRAIQILRALVPPDRAA